MSDQLDKSLAAMKVSIDSLEKSVANLIAQREACVGALMVAPQLCELGKDIEGLKGCPEFEKRRHAAIGESRIILARIDAALALCAGKDKSDAMACQMMRNSEVGE